MRFIVHIPELDFALYENDIQRARQEISTIIQKLKRSGKLLDGGILADDHGGFLIVESASWNELEALLGPVFDPLRFRVEVHPVLTFEGLEHLFQTLERNGPSVSGDADRHTRKPVPLALS